MGLSITMLKINDILVDSFQEHRIIDIQPDYVVALLIHNFDGAVDQDEDNIGEFIMRNDIAEDL